MNPITNGSFTRWSKGTRFGMYNQYVETADDWMIKTMDGPLNAVVSRHSQGMQVEAYFPKRGYLYVRQLIPDVMRFSKATGTITIDVTRESWQPIHYDVYIRARLTADNSVWRPLAVDTPDKVLKNGRQTIIVPFEVPDLTPDQHKIEDGNALTTAFRLIGGFDQNTKNTRCIIHSISMDVDLAGTQPVPQPPSSECKTGLLINEIQTVMEKYR